MSMQRTIASVSTASLTLLATLAVVLGFAATLAAAEPDGKALYAKHCSSCHGMDGAAGTPAGKALKAAVLKDPKFAEIDAATVKAGLHENPKHKAVSGAVNDAEIAAITAHIHELARSAGGAAAPK
jgi:mono/diheme cytochrome c family protein